MGESIRTTARERVRPNIPVRSREPALFYFAYGSNLNHEGMTARCPDALAVRAGILKGWTLTFRGVADIKPYSDALTHGALWRISERDLNRLDRYEGWPSLYRRELLPVRTAHEEVMAIAYVMNDDYLGLPSPLYYRTIMRGYEQWDLPLDALETAVATVKKKMSKLGVTTFVADGPKRLRPA